MKHKSCIWIAIGLSAMFLDAIGQDEATNLGDLTWKIRHDALEALTERMTTATVFERDKMALDIVEFIEHGTHDHEFGGGLHMAIKALGELKSDVAIPCLTRHLSFLPQSGLDTERRPTEMYYPAAVALRKTGGESVVDAMRALLGNRAADDIETRLALWVLCETEGYGTVEQFIAGQTEPLRLSTGVSLLDLLPDVGRIVASPFNLQEWDFGASAFVPNPNFQVFLKRLAMHPVDGGNDSIRRDVYPKSEESGVPDCMELENRIFREMLANIAENPSRLCSLLGDLAWFGSHATTREEAELPFVVMSWMDVSPQIFAMALKPHLKSRDSNMAAFAATWLEKVLSEQEMQTQGQ